MIIEFTGLKEHIQHMKDFQEKMSDMQSLGDAVGMCIVERFETQIGADGNPFPSPKSDNTLAANPGRNKWGIAQGNLMKAITYEVDGDTVNVGDNVPHSKYIQFGTPPHEIFPKRSRVLRFMTTHGLQFSAKVNHPGTPPAPFYGLTKENLDEIEKIIQLWKENNWKK